MINPAKKAPKAGEIPIIEVIHVTAKIITTIDEEGKVKESHTYGLWPGSHPNDKNKGYLESDVKIDKEIFLKYSSLVVPNFKSSNQTIGEILDRMADNFDVFINMKNNEVEVKQ